MPDRNELIEQKLQFIQEHRSNESHFEKLNTLLEQVLEDKELVNGASDKSFLEALNAVKQKQSEEYRVMKEKQGSAWPEFEKFVSQFERSLIDAKNA